MKKKAKFHEAKTELPPEKQGKKHKLDVSFPAPIEKTAIVPRPGRAEPGKRRTLKPGETLEVPTKYVIKGTIGAGGIGDVYIAEKQIRVPGFVHPIAIPQAIKIISPESSLLQERGGYKLLEQLLWQEAAINLRLGGNPFTARVEDIVPLGNQSLALVLELIKGHTLRAFNREHLSRGQLVPCDIVAFLAYRIASVLLQAFKKGISHRDLSDGNVMLHESGALKLLDWGNAEGLLGKPGYQAPEDMKDAAAVNRRKDGPAKADIFCLGVLIRQLLVGANVLQPPRQFQGRAGWDYRKRQDLAKLIPLHELCLDVPRELSDIVQSCMQEQPQDRPSVKELYHDLLGQYLYAEGVNFTADVLGSYLEAFDRNPLPDTAIVDDESGANLMKVIQWRHMREEGEEKPPAAAAAEEHRYSEVGRSVVDAYGMSPVKSALERVIAQQYETAMDRAGSTEQKRKLADQCAVQLNSVTHADPAGLKRFFSTHTEANRRLNRRVVAQLLAGLRQFQP